jgi:23S rRNA (cytosine1962-C5)-methyltransferase
MNILSTPGWEDYELLDSGNGRRLERFGKYILNRPDPQAIWLPHLPETEWQKADATFNKDWATKANMPKNWNIKYGDLTLEARLTPFKHTGIFPEQSINWQYIEQKIKTSKTQNIKFLNLFGYTGISSLVAAKNGASVTHVDASKPAMTWFRKNQELSGLTDKPIRLIVDDALKFTEREIKRGNSYDAVIMDPPIYGHTPDGGVWDFNRNFPKLMENVSKILSPNPLFVTVNAYAISASAIMIENVMKDFLPKSGKYESGELCLEENSGRLLSTGIYGKWEI